MLFFCEKDSRYICIKSEWLNFAIPRDINKNQVRRWVYAGVNYELIFSGKVEIFGKMFDVFFVKNLKEGFEYIYSFDYGLMAISAKIDGCVVSFFAEKEFGWNGDLGDK